MKKHSLFLAILLLTISNNGWSGESDHKIECSGWYNILSTPEAKRFNFSEIFEYREDFPKQVFFEVSDFRDDEYKHSSRLELSVKDGELVIEERSIEGVLDWNHISKVKGAITNVNFGKKQFITGSVSIFADSNSRRSFSAKCEIIAGTHGQAAEIPVVEPKASGFGGW
ncbi:MAG: hypothetical protein HOE90_10425 [Bacteriovoracaceae bacterium]|mgnify:CR=1 FL=1|jgi:hypothetical protein|nr:hypothetical protein [Bacteriovoracaceae bacterium]